MKNLADNPTDLMKRIRIERAVNLLVKELDGGMVQHLYHILGETLTRSPHKTEFDIVLDSVIAELMRYKLSQQLPDEFK
jgi:hypothetical protein